MFAPSAAATVAAARSFPPNSLLMGAVQPPSHHSLQQHHHLPQQQQQQHHQVGATAAAVASLCTQFSLPPPHAPQLSAMHNSELARQLLSAELAARLVHDRMLLAPPDGAQQMSTFAQRHHAQQTSRQAVKTTPTTEAAMLHQHFMSAAAAAAAAMASTSVASATQGPTMGSMPSMAGPLLQPGGSFTASLHQLMQMSSVAAASSQHIPGRPPNSSGAGAPVDVLNDAAAAALVVGMPGAFQPKGCPTMMEMNSRSPMLPPGVRDRNHTTSIPPLASGRVGMKKSGHWCAAHVRTAWAIHVRQQYQKQQEAAVRSSSDHFHASAKLPPLPLMSQLYTQTASRTGGPSSLRDQTDLRPPGINLNADALSMFSGSSPYCSPDVALGITKPPGGRENSSATGLVPNNQHSYVTSGRNSNDKLSNHKNDKRKVDRKVTMDKRGHESPQGKRVPESAFSLTDSDDQATRSPSRDETRRRRSRSRSPLSAGDGSRQRRRDGNTERSRAASARETHAVRAKDEGESIHRSRRGIGQRTTGSGDGSSSNSDDNEDDGFRRAPSDRQSRSFADDESLKADVRRLSDSNSPTVTCDATSRPQSSDNYSAIYGRLWNPFFRHHQDAASGNPSIASAATTATAAEARCSASLDGGESSTETLHQTVDEVVAAALTATAASVGDTVRQTCVRPDATQSDVTELPINTVVDVENV